MPSQNSIDTDFPIEVAAGGQGNVSLTQYGILIGNGTSPVTVSSVGTATQVFTSNGAGVDPTFQTAPTTSMIFQSVSLDPASPTNGQVWYNSTADTFRGRANGITRTFTVT